MKEGEVFGSITGKPNGGFHYENFTIHNEGPFGPEEVCMFVIRCMLEELERMKKWREDVREKEREWEQKYTQEHRFGYKGTSPRKKLL